MIRVSFYVFLSHADILSCEVSTPVLVHFSVCMLFSLTVRNSLNIQVKSPLLLRYSNALSQFFSLNNIF